MKPHHYSCAGKVVARVKNLPSCRGEVTPRTRPRLRRAIVAFSLAALGMAAFDPVSPAFSGTPSPVTLTGLFEPDFADLKVTPDLKAAIENAHKDPCYPPRATFKVVTRQAQGAEDPLFFNTLAEWRAKALARAVPSLGLAADQFKTEWVVSGSTDYVLVSYDPFATDDGDPPILNVTWDPPNGSEVKPGGQIKITVTASERYEDGHKSWPSGVRGIRLIHVGSPGGPVEDYGQKPPPCERRTLERPYTVPKENPPSKVVLQVGVRDAAGHPTSQTAEFPLLTQSACLERMRWGKWRGTIVRDFESGSYHPQSETAMSGKPEERRMAALHGSSWWQTTENGHAAVEFFSVVDRDLHQSPRVLSSQPALGPGDVRPVRVRIAGKQTTSVSVTYKDGHKENRPQPSDDFNPSFRRPDFAEVCPHGPASMRMERGEGKKGSWENYFREVVTWNYSFQGKEEPQFAAMVKNLPDYDSEDLAKEYRERARAIVDAVFDKLRGRRPQTPLKTLIDINETLRRAFDRLPQAESAWNKILTLHFNARALWASDKPEDDPKYASKLRELKTAVSEYTSAVQSLPAGWAAGVDDVAAKLERLDRSAASQLRALAQEIRKK